MEIKRIAQPQEPLRRMDPSEVLADRNPVWVHLDDEITLELEGRAVVSYGPGEVAAPAIVANALVEVGGGVIIGSNFPPRTKASKPAPMRYVGGPFEGTRRWKLS
jgi:hypothetical protein